MKLLSFTITLFSSSIVTTYARQILQTFPGQAELPPLTQTRVWSDGARIPANTTMNREDALDLNNIQGDILVGMKKLKETFFFFHINDGQSFKSKLQTTLLPYITTTAQLLNPDFSPDALVNVAFSKSGLEAMGVEGSPGDKPWADYEPFNRGQYADAYSLGDDLDLWLEPFKGKNIHGVFLIASDDFDPITAMKEELDLVIGSDYTIVHSLEGSSRPGAEAGREHFGYADGIAQPAISLFTTNPMPGQMMVDPGVILQNRTGDQYGRRRPGWARDGSVLVFRQLQQLVPEFKKFLWDNRIRAPGMTAQHGADLLGARMVGRWKSGAPIDITPLFDDPALGADPMRNNDFNFDHPEIPGFNIKVHQYRCPFSAHIRKTRVRSDEKFEEVEHQIMRAGIPFGPEVTPEEYATNTTTLNRGLAFVSYQSSLREGFRTQQRRWANDPGFKRGKIDPTVGADPIIGQERRGPPGAVSGLDPFRPNLDIHVLDRHVIARGGEYFFSPSLEALRTGFA